MTATISGKTTDESVERVSMARNTATVTGAGYHRALLDAECLSDSVREFRDAVLHVGERLKLDGRRDMLAEKRTNPLTYMAKLYLAGRRAHLPKNWALKLIAWQRLLVERLWATDFKPIEALAEAEQAAEHCANVMHLRYLHQRTAEARRAWEDAEAKEQAASMELLTAMGRDAL
jgi:hypothetical protein